MDFRQLNSILLLLILGTFITTANADYRGQPVHEIQCGTNAHASPSNADYGKIIPVSAEECKGAGEHINKEATVTSSVTPVKHGVKYTSTQVPWYGIFLADCGGGVYVKVIDKGDFFVFYESDDC